MFGTFLLYLRSFFAIDRKGVLVATALTLAGALVEGLLALSLVPVLEVFLGISGSGTGDRVADLLRRSGFGDEGALLVFAGALFAVLVLARSTIAWFRTMQLARVSQGFVRHWRIRLFAALDQADWQNALDHKQYEIQHVLTEDVGRIAYGAESTIRSSTGVALILAQICVAFAIAPALATVFLAIAIAALLPLRKALLTTSRKRGAVQVENARRQYSDLNDYLAGLKTTKIHPHRDFGRRMKQIAEAISDNMLAFSRNQANVQLALQLGSAALLFVLLALGLLVFGTAPAILIVFLAIILRITPPVFALVGSVQAMANTLPAFENVIAVDASLSASIRDHSAQQAEPARSSPREGGIGVELRSVSFAYRSSGAPVLQDLSMKIAPGTMVALLGPTGVGKTTVLDLVTGIVRPDTGTVRAWRAGGEELGRDGLRAALSYATQDPVLFDTSIRENLLWSGSEASDEEILNALDITAARDFVESLPQGLDTRVGEMGMQLSGGERQRLFLAAMILRRPGLLILDEATSAVDYRTEARILANLKSMTRAMTIIAVTHRPPDPAIFDRTMDLAAHRPR